MEFETVAHASYADVMSSLSGIPGVRYVEPDFIVSISSTLPNDSSYPSLYGMNNIAAPEAWDLTTGGSVVAGVIDSGVDYNHPDLAANMWRNPGEIAGDGIDNDGNGYQDDVFGYDFVNNDSDPMDDHGHGTHVSGTIGAVGNNGVGVVGVNWQSKIMALKFLGSNGSGPISAAVSALNYATKMRTTYGVNIRLTNNSWGGGAFSQAMQDAISASGIAGMLFVVSAGNNASNNDTTLYYPASYNLPNVVSVAATDQNDVLASFSNYGATTVDLAAPGVSILSTTRNNTYGSMSGTSMAAPHVSGVATLAWNLNPSATYQQIRDALYAGVDPISGLVDKTATGGRLNAQSTLNLLLGDAGDTLAAARGTNLNAPGNRFLVPNATIGDGSFTTRDVDMYRFTAPAGGTLTAITSQPAGSTVMNTVLRLFDSNGTPLAVNDDSAGSYSQLNFTFSDAGTYYIGVSGSPNIAYDPTSAGSGVEGSTGEYRLELGLDVGDDLSTALTTSLVLGSTYIVPRTAIGDGPLSNQDVDLYRFSASAGTALTAVSSRPSGGSTMETALRLFDNAGNPLAAVDSPVSSYSRLNFTFTSTGTYYLGVSGSGNLGYDPVAGIGGNPGSTGDYRLDLSLATTSPAEFDLGSLIGGDGSKGFVLSGQAAYEELWGTPQYQPLGDVNQDTYADFLFGAPGDINVTVGKAYLIFGQAGGFPAEVNLASLDGTNGYVLNGMVVSDRVGFLAGSAGDLNDDSVPDMVIGAIAASPASDRLKAGQTFVVYGGATNLIELDLADGSQDGSIALTSLDGDHGFTINGVATDDNAGRAMSVGDLNADGFDDLAIGTPVADPAGKTSAGQVYVVYGRNSFSAVFELSSLNGDNGFTIPGLVASDFFGVSLGGAGDVNSDGVDDMIIGASSADPAGRLNAGQAYVIFGRSTFPPTFDLTTLNGTTGFTLNGAVASDTFGTSVQRAGDLNGDGIGDLVIGATGVDVPGKSGVGAAYVVFGKETATAGAFPAVMEVTSLNGTNGAAFIGVAQFDSAGSSVSWLGDVNADGYDDLFIGASGADPGGQSAAGQSYVYFGSSSFAASFELASLLAMNGGNASNGFVLNGYQEGAGASRISGVGDVNGDGIADLRVSAPYTDLNEMTAPGQVYIVYGKPSLPAIRVTPPSGLTTNESGGTGKFTVSLTAEPTDPVTISVNTTDVSEGTVSTSSLTFTEANWNQPQTVTVTGVNDNYSDGDIGYGVVLGAAVSADPVFNGMDPADLSLTNIDNDTFNTTFTQPENKAIPDRGTYTSSLVISSTGKILDLNVRVNITHGWDEDLDVFLIAPDGTRIELFTDVGSMGVNFTNTVLDDEATVLITSGAAPFTGTYRPEGNLTSLEGKNITGTWKLEAKDDARFIAGTLVDWAITASYTTATMAMPNAIVTPVSGLVTTEGGGNATFTVRLDNAPSANVVIPVTSGDTTEGSVSVSSLTFTPANWNTAQTVTITGVDDSAADGNVPYSVVLGPAASADPDFNGLNPVDVSLTNTDNDIVTTTFTQSTSQLIPDQGTRNSTLNIATDGTILDIDVRVNISHTSDADLDVFLRAPDGTRIELFTDVGGSGDHFSNTVLSDEATIAITSGSAPFTGTYRAEGNLALFEGRSLAGTWTLEVTDDAKNSTGTLQNWSLIVRYALPGTAGSGDGGSLVIGNNLNGNKSTEPMVMLESPLNKPETRLPTQQVPIAGPEFGKLTSSNVENSSLDSKRAFSGYGTQKVYNDPKRVNLHKSSEFISSQVDSRSNTIGLFGIGDLFEDELCLLGICVEAS